MINDIEKKSMAVPGKKHLVADFDPAFTGTLNKEEAIGLLQANTERTAELQNTLYAEDRYAVLLIFQAMDAAGKDGTIKHVLSGINPQGCQVYSFKQPSAEELDHDYLWRVSKNLPERGRIGIFNRSHYEDVLISKVHPEMLLKNHLPDVISLDDLTEEFWQRRYRQINERERYLTETGTVVLKFFLNVSHGEQEKRFLSRLKDPTKNWKFSASDLAERAYWDDYMRVYSEMLTATSTEYAPWYVIPADKKWFMRYAVSEILRLKMESLDLHYPVVDASARLKIEEARQQLMGIQGKV